MRIVALLTGLLITFAAAAQDYPARPIRMLVGYAPGGSGDFVTRLMATEMAKDMNASIVVENMAGAGGNIANAAAARAPADGYTVLLATHFAINKALYRSNMNYDPDKDFVPISRVAAGPTVIVVKNDLPVKSLKELIAYGLANPGTLTNASAGFGSAPHLSSVLFESVTGVKFTSVQYKGGGPAATSILSGETDVLFAALPTVRGFIEAGRMRALAVTTRDTSAAAPGIPGTEQAGLPGYEFTFWFGLFVPAGTPADVVTKLQQSAARVLAKPEVKERMALQGMDAAPSASPAAFDAEIRSEAPMWESLVQRAGAKVE